MVTLVVVTDSYFWTSNWIGFWFHFVWPPSGPASRAVIFVNKSVLDSIIMYSHRQSERRIWVFYQDKIGHKIHGSAALRKKNHGQKIIEGWYILNKNPDFGPWIWLKPRSFQFGGWARKPGPPQGTWPLDPIHSGLPSKPMKCQILQILFYFILA